MNVQAAVDAIIAACVRAGSVTGFNLHHWEDGPGLCKKGRRWFTLHARTMLTRGAQQVQALVGADASTAQGRANPSQGGST